MHSLKISSIIFPILFTFAFIPNMSYGDEEREFHRMLRSIEKKNPKKFESLLKKGGDPSNIGRHDDPFNWINCQAALADTSVFLELITKYGGNVFHIREDFARSTYYAPAASSLQCSVTNLSIAPFIYLIEEGADISISKCHLCENENFHANLLEAIFLFNSYDKALWLFQERRDGARRMINKSVVRSMNDVHEGLAKRMRPAFWQLVDIFNTMGYQIEPRLAREKFND